MARISRSGVLVIFAAVVVLVVAACGGSSGGSSQATASSTSATTSRSPTGTTATSTASMSTGTTSTTLTSGTTLTTSPATEPTYLSDLPTVSGGINTGSAEVNGTLIAKSLIMDPTFGPDQVEYNLGRHWKHLQATVGIRDDSATNAQVRMDAFGDERPLYSQVFALGQSDQIDLDVLGVLRLRLVATLTSKPNGQATPVWGDAKLSSTP